MILNLVLRSCPNIVGKIIRTQPVDNDICICIQNMLEVKLVTVVLRQIPRTFLGAITIWQTNGWRGESMSASDGHVVHLDLVWQHVLVDLLCQLVCK